MKILFSCVGRRVELVQAFRLAANNLNIELEIIGADISETAPAIFFCDNYKIVPRVTDKDYIKVLSGICKREEIDCLIPTIDTDLLLLAQNKRLFEDSGTKVLISSVDKVALCRDKNNTAKYFRSIGLVAPETVNNIYEYTDGFPAFIKPKDGSSSVNAFKVNNFNELKEFAKNIPNYVVQPFIDGDEYTIDIFCDYDGNPVFITPRERIAVRAGEVLKTRINLDETMINQMLTLIADFKPCGQITVQLIKHRETGINYYIEINPRFGGGAPLSIKAGANSAEAILKMLRQDKLVFNRNAAKDGLIYCRFDQSICVNG